MELYRNIMSDTIYCLPHVHVQLVIALCAYEIGSVIRVGLIIDLGECVTLGKAKQFSK